MINSEYIEIADWTNKPVLLNANVSYQIIEWYWHQFIWTLLTYCTYNYARRTQAQNVNVPRLILQLSLPNPLKPGVKSRMKM